MNGRAEPPTETPRFPTLAALKQAHASLLQRRRAEGDSPMLLDDVAAFIVRAQATGALLDNDDARDAAQSLLTYWDNLLYRAERTPPESTLSEFDPQLAPTLPDELCPYLGLDSFHENDNSKFFGRHELVTRLAERLAERRLIAVVGPSGSGKSSVVRAGLVPALKRGALPGSAGWRYPPPIMPGSNPLAALDRALAFAQNEPTPTAGAASAPCLLVIDQFEELFTLCDGQAARMAFADQLLALLQAGAGDRVILTMRSDFETFVARLPQLQPLFEAGRVQVTPLSAAELREAIERPAEAIGLKFEADVVDALLQDILGEPAGLPLLQFTLLKLWEQRERNRITRAAYERVGGGRLALARSADQLYAGLIPEEQVTARRILLRLVRPGEGLEITSSRIRRAELYHGGEDPGRVDRVLEKLIGARLLRLSEGETLGDAQIELAHEALVRNWPTLVDWLEQEKAAIATRRRFEIRAAEWLRLGKGQGGLLDEIELREAERWLASSEAAYLGYGPALPELVAASKRAIGQRARRSARLRLALVLSALAAGVFGVALAVFAFQQRTAALGAATLAQQNASAAGTAEAQAREQRNLAQTAQAQAQQEATLARTAEAQTQSQNQIVESQQLAFAANSQLGSAPETALLLAYEAAARDKNPISERALRDAIDRASWQPTVINNESSPVRGAVFSPDGARILTASFDGARLWDLNGQLVARFTGHAGPINSAVFSPDGTRILTASDDRTARLWDTSGQLLVTFAGHTNTVSSAAFSPDGTRVLTGSFDGTARLWDLNGQQIATLDAGGVLNALFSPDGTRILTAPQASTGQLWDAQGKRLADLPGHEYSLWIAAWSPDSQRFVTGSEINGVFVWDRSGKRLPIKLQTKGVVRSAAFSPDSARIVTVIPSSGLVQVWDAAGNLVSTLKDNAGFVQTAVFSPDGARVLTASDDGTARLWNIDGQLLAILQGHTGAIASAAFSPDGARILTGSFDGTLRLWSPASPALPSFAVGNYPRNIAYSPDNKRILISLDNGTALLREANGQPTAVLTGHVGLIISAVFSPDGQRILTASFDQTARVWDLRGQQLALLQGHTSILNSAVFSPDGTRILTASDDGTARLWDISGKQVRSFGEHSNRVQSAVFSPDGARVLLVARGTAEIWDINGKQPLKTLSDTNPFEQAMFSLNGTRVFTFGRENAALWDLNGTLRATLTRLDSPVGTAAAFSPNGQRIVTAYINGNALVWDEAGNVLATLPGNGYVNSAVFSPDGSRILLASSDGTARLWSTQGQLLGLLQGAPGFVNRGIFSPDGSRILLISDDYIARQYLVKAGDLLKVAACRAGRRLNEAEIAQFQVPTPLKLAFANRQCPPALGN